MKITKKTKPLEPGTVVWLFDEFFKIVEYVDALGGVYKIQPLEPDGDDYIPVGDVRSIYARELVGGEI